MHIVVTSVVKMGSFHFGTGSKWKCLICWSVLTSGLDMAPGEIITHILEHIWTKLLSFSTKQTTYKYLIRTLEFISESGTAVRFDEMVSNPIPSQWTRINLICLFHWEVSNKITHSTQIIQRAHSVQHLSITHRDTHNHTLGQFRFSS